MNLNRDNNGNDDQNPESADFLFFYSLDLQEEAIASLRAFDIKICFLVFFALLFSLGYVLKDAGILVASIDIGFWNVFFLLFGKFTLFLGMFVLSFSFVGGEGFSHVVALPTCVLDELKSHSLSECQVALTKEIDKEIQRIAEETVSRKEQFGAGLFFLILSFPCLLFA